MSESISNTCQGGVIGGVKRRLLSKEIKYLSSETYAIGKIGLARKASA